MVFVSLILQIVPKETTEILEEMTEIAIEIVMVHRIALGRIPGEHLTKLLVEKEWFWLVKRQVLKEGLDPHVEGQVVEGVEVVTVAKGLVEEEVIQVLVLELMLTLQVKLVEKINPVQVKVRMKGHKVQLVVEAKVPVQESHHSLNEKNLEAQGGVEEVVEGVEAFLGVTMAMVTLATRNLIQVVGIWRKGKMLYKVILVHLNLN